MARSETGIATGWRRKLTGALLFVVAVAIGFLGATFGADEPQNAPAEPAESTAVGQFACTPRQWEYTILKTGPPAQTELQWVIDTMNANGAFGWEAFSTDFNTDNLLALHNYVSFRRNDCSAYFQTGSPPVTGDLLE